MTKKQANKSKIVKSEEQIQIERNDANISAMADHAALVIRSQNTISSTNVDELKSNLESYHSLSEALANNNDLSVTQKSRAKGIREQFRKDVLPGLNSRIAGVIKVREEAKNKLKADQEKQAAEAKVAQKGFNKLLPELTLAAERYLKAGLSEGNILLDRFKLIQSRINVYLEKGTLPDSVRKKLLGQVIEISQRVNHHSDKLDNEARVVGNTINRALKEASNNLQNVTILGLLVKFMPNLSKVDVARILGQDSLKLIGHKSVESAGTMIVANLPAPAQTALMNAIVHEMVTSRNVTGPLASFVLAIREQIGGLLSGEKQFLSIVALKDTKVQMVHISIADLLANPHDMLFKVMMGMYVQGVRDDQIIMRLTSSDQVGALLRIEGLNLALLQKTGVLEAFIRLLYANNQYTPAQMSALLGFEAKGNQLVQSSNKLQALIELLVNKDNQTLTIREASEQLNMVGNTLRLLPSVQALEAIIDLITSPVSSAALVSALGDIKLSPENIEQIKIFEAKMDSLPTAGFDSVQILNLMTTIATMMDARSLLLGTTPKEQEEQLLDLPDIEQLSIEHKEQSPRDSLEEAEQETGYEDIAKQKLDLTQEESQFKSLIAKLGEIHSHLSKQGDSANYRKALRNLEDTRNILNTTGAKFFKTPNANTLSAFNECVKMSFESTEKELSNHRGWHSINAIFKSILGIVAALTVIPALVVQAKAKEGYVGTFFATPKTTSSKLFESVKSITGTLQEDLNKKINTEDETGYTPKGS